LPEIVGIATFAIDESSTFMNVARATASVASTSFPPESGGGPARFVEVFMLSVSFDSGLFVDAI
jgi:hypothetical protein